MFELETSTMTPPTKGPNHKDASKLEVVFDFLFLIFLLDTQIWFEIIHEIYIEPHKMQNLA